MNVSSLEFNFVDFEFVTLLQYMAKTLAWYLIFQKQLVREIRKINTTQNLRVLQYVVDRHYAPIFDQCSLAQGKGKREELIYAYLIDGDIYGTYAYSELHQNLLFLSSSSFLFSCLIYLCSVQTLIFLQ